MNGISERSLLVLRGLGGIVTFILVVLLIVPCTVLMCVEWWLTDTDYTFYPIFGLMDWTEKAFKIG